jgi:hypothetical protein
MLAPSLGRVQGAGMACRPCGKSQGEPVKERKFNAGSSGGFLLTPPLPVVGRENIRLPGSGPARSRLEME